MGRRNFNYDWVSITLLFLLGSFGLFLLLTTNRGLFVQQSLYLLLGFGLLFLVARLDGILLWWFAPIGYVLSLILLAASFLGPSIRGATRWIVLGGVQLQPSELVKPLLLLAFARFIAQFPPRSFRCLPLHLLLWGIPFILVFWQPDLGTSLIYTGMWLSAMLAGGLSFSLVIAGAVLGILGLPFVWRLLANYQRLRVLTFLNPSLDPRGAGYNAIQAMIAVGSGQLFGRGLGRGTQSHLRFLPEFHTDFIFATLVEELGLIGGLLLLLFYALLVWRLVAPFLRGEATELFVLVYTMGLFGLLLGQIFINTGMNLGILPVTGITLPFVSYGGSSILSLSVAFGILFALRRVQPETTRIATGKTA